MSEDLIPTIPEFFNGKNIFMTGGTGFIGKVLIEKLLRSCPDVGKIYLLIRPKKGKNAEERIGAITDLPLFDLLKEQYPENLKKIVPVVGDVIELSLGLSPEDRNTLIQDVNIVYHIAASVRFDEPLRDAVLMNTRGTREAVKLAKEMKNLDVFFHFSTTYCNTDRTVVDEKIYPPHADWRETIEIIENADPHLLDVFSEKYIHPLPNTYTFSKSLAEHVVNDLCDAQVPAVILRPSIVINTMLEPVSGWIDNFNGPVGILVASGKGVMRSVYAEPNVIADYVPCDVLLKGAIIATWKKGIEKGLDRYKVSIYNGSSNKLKYVTMGGLVDLGKKLCWETPLNDIIWYPNGSITNSWYYNYYRVIFYQLLPALIIDGLLVLSGRKPMLIKVHRKIFLANSALNYFLVNEWEFKNTKMVAIEDSLLPSDVEAFSYHKDHELAEPLNFFTAGLMGARRYLLKEPDSTMPQAIVHSRRMWIIAQIFNALWYFVAVWILYKIIMKISSDLDLYAYLNN